MQTRMLVLALATFSIFAVQASPQYILKVENHTNQTLKLAPPKTALSEWAENQNLDNLRAINPGDFVLWLINLEEHQDIKIKYENDLASCTISPHIKYNNNQTSALGKHCTLHNTSSPEPYQSVAIIGSH